jgi:hypothetical protein
LVRDSNFGQYRHLSLADSFPSFLEQETEYPPFPALLKYWNNHFKGQRKSHNIKFCKRLLVLDSYKIGPLPDDKFGVATGLRQKYYLTKEGRKVVR